MKVDNTQNINKYLSKNKANLGKKNLDVGGEIKGELVNGKAELGEIFERTVGEGKIYAYDLEWIEELKAGSEDLYGKLQKMVEDLLADQNKALELLKQADLIGLDKGAVEEARQFTSEGGPRGIEAMSEKIVEFVKVASGENIGKLEALIKAIDIVFKEVEKDLGGLAEVSQKTYDRIMEKLDNLISTEILKKESGSTDIQFQTILEEKIMDQDETLKLLKQLDIVMVEKTGTGGVENSIEVKALLDREVMSEKIVKEILRDESKAFELLKQMELSKIDTATIAKVKQLIAPGGRLGVEAVSDRIIELIETASNGDMERIFHLARIIDKIFYEGKNLGELSFISEKTYHRIMRKLQNIYPVPAVLYQISSLYYKLKDQSAFRVRTYFAILAFIILYYTIRGLMQ